jgi:hypothetical protein
MGCYCTKKVGRLSERKRVVAGRGDGIFAIFPRNFRPSP